MQQPRCSRSTWPHPPGLDGEEEHSEGEVTENIVCPEETERLQYLGNHYCNQWRSVPKRERGKEERREGK